MTSLYGVTRYFDYGYLERILYGTPPAEPDDCSGCYRAPPPCQSCPSPCDQENNQAVAIAGWLERHRPRWYALLVRSQLVYALNSDLTARTLFLPPEEAIDTYGIDEWNYGMLRRLFARLIIDRPISDRYLRRSLGYKLYTFENYDPVYIFAGYGNRWFFQDESNEIGGSVGIPIPERVNAGYNGAGRTMHWIHFLSTIPSLQCTLGVYGD